MNEEDLEYFREKMIQMRRDILDESAHTLHDMQAESTLFPDPNDRASLETDRNTMLRIRDRERKLLTKIQEALDRIEDGTFGLCIECDELIDKERLDIRPVTTLCIACKKEQEEEERYKRVKWRAKSAV